MAIDRGVYAVDGSLRVTVVTGSTYVGTYAPDGSLNIKIRSSEFGYYHSSGAALVTVRSTPGSSVYASDGSLYVSASPYVYGSQRVTVVSGSLSSLSTPVLAMDPLWVTTDNTPDFTADFDATVVAGDSFRLQIQVSGGDWSSPVSDTNHTITAPEDAADEASLSNRALSNGNYQARCNVTDGAVTSSWSNIVSFTIAAATWQLEANTDHWQLEDASGNWILEA